MDEIHTYFQTHINAKLFQLCSELPNTKLDNWSVSEFLLKIQTTIDSVHAIGESISPCEHLDLTLEGMHQDYESTISLISGRIGSIPTEVGILLLGHDARLERFRKMASPTTNLTASSTANDAESTQALSSNLEQQSFWHFSDGSDERGDRSGHRGHGGNGCDGRSSIQCQVCHKFGHDASICYHRFKKDYTPSVPLDHQQQSNNSNFSWSNSTNSMFNGNIPQSPMPWQSTSCPVPWSHNPLNHFGPPLHSMPPLPTLSTPHYNFYPPQNFMPSFTSALQPKPQALVANFD